MKKKFSRIVSYKYMYLMLFLGFVVTGIFQYAPMYGLYMAFSDYRLGRPILSSEFIGLANFKEFIINSADMSYVLRNTLAMNIFSLTIGLGTSMVFAILINEIRILKFKKIVQTVSFFPFFISWVIVYNIFSTFLSVETGVVNVTMKNLGIITDGINFMGDPKYSWGLIVATNLWKTLGYNSVLFLTSIVGIDLEIFEAANIDGADRLQKIWHITVPSILPTLQVLLIMNVGWIFSSNFDQFYLFTNAMNRSTMEVFDMYIYRFGMRQLNYSYATAVGIAKTLAGVAMLVLVNFTSKKINGKSIL